MTPHNEKREDPGEEVVEKYTRLQGHNAISKWRVRAHRQVISWLFTVYGFYSKVSKSDVAFISKTTQHDCNTNNLFPVT